MPMDQSKFMLVGSDDRLRAAFCIRKGDAYKLNEELSLPKRNDHDYTERLKHLFSVYQDSIARGKAVFKISDFTVVSELVFMLSHNVLCALDEYHKGFPAAAYSEFEKALDMLSEDLRNHLKGKRGDGFLTVRQDDSSSNLDNLFRMRSVSDSKAYAPKDTFHVPTSRRQAISSCRYSIAGHPSLYLTDSLKLAYREVGLPSSAIASHFSMVEKHGILDLGIRPDDFDFNGEQGEQINDHFVLRYLCWHPIIAACSFVRADAEGFHDEYIIPQLLMQWVRSIGRPPYTPALGIDRTSYTIRNVSTNYRLRSEWETLYNADYYEDYKKYKKILIDKITRSIVELNSTLCDSSSRSKTPLKELNEEADRIEGDLREAERIHSHEKDAAGILFDRSARLALYLFCIHPFLKRVHRFDELKRAVSLISNASYDLAVAIHVHGKQRQKSDEFHDNELAIKNRLISLYVETEGLSNTMAPERAPEDDISLLDTLWKCLRVLRMRLAIMSSLRTKSLNYRNYWTLRITINECLRNIDWALKSGPEIVGIRYFSCRDKLAAGLGRNYVFPAELESVTDEGFSIPLAKNFKWTRPRHLEDFPTPEDCQKQLAKDDPINGVDALNESA